ncbi:MAG: transcription elongation factor GreA [Bacilli bacterium]|nr:transcription elongation factor GreA [Bacilli bacterium]
MQKKIIELTEEGLNQIKTELDKLRNEDRPRIIQALKDARAQGDLSENADYDAARAEQASVEGRIQELEYMVDNHKIVEISKDEVGLGSIVDIMYVDDDETETYKIVGPTEVDINDNKISNASPIGKAICGHKKGETCEVESPNGTYKVKIVSIK